MEKWRCLKQYTCIVAEAILFQKPGDSIPILKGISGIWLICLFEDTMIGCINAIRKESLKGAVH